MHDGAMTTRPCPHSSQSAVCGQAHTVFENLTRTRSLPTGLSVSIEEILERAWEIAYRRQDRALRDNVIRPVQWRHKSVRGDCLDARAGITSQPGPHIS